MCMHTARVRCFFKCVRALKASMSTPRVHHPMHSRAPTAAGQQSSCPLQHLQEMLCSMQCALVGCAGSCLLLLAA